MIGRNDPCLCGSGKKYKKCCQSKNAVSIETVQQDELERALQTFYDEYPERKDIPEYLKLANEWKQSLGTYMPEEMIEAIAMDEFFFNHRSDIWLGYLDKQKKKLLRPSVLRVVETWQNPRSFIGEVIEVDDTYITVQMIFNDEIIKLRRESEKPVPVGVHLFCFVLPDGTGDENHYLAVSSLLFFPTDHTNAIKEFAKRFSTEEALSVSTFLKENALDFWKCLGDDGYEGGEFTNFEAGVLLSAIEFLEKHNRDPKELLDVVEDFLVEQQPNARKEMAIAAGAIRFGQDNSFFEPISMPLKEIAEWFEVSPSSMNKYSKDLEAYYTAKVTN
ncbi:SEC-C metal-binding domain-containing protein [Sporosarcina luteola]|uniref:YecA family protein n=1 Tax=Sporosarcina luteola TaxID=582850 RepID=UPI00203AE5E2|nr:SEC-C metal-binding domain-containing protein [Sporosarcina luteola]MCM3639124.1 SEC-C metal-binding domain-containing protein [Sporosarcina luteola]